MYNQVIVVEGLHDEQKIKSIYPGIECIVTNGSAISKETINLIYETSQKKEVILFLDPDYPGKKITNEILKTKGNYKIAFLSKDKAISSNQKKVGIEHAKAKDIKDSLDSSISVSFVKESSVTLRDLSERKLVNNPNSRTKRAHLCKSLNIPLLNGKSLLKYLNLLNISVERIDKINYERF